MKRTQFVRMLSLGAGYIAVAGCMSACKNRASRVEEPLKAHAQPREESPAGFNIDLSNPKYAELSKPGAYVYVNNLIIARTTDGELVAFPKKCPHQGGPLAYHADTGLFQCPWHGAQFSGKGELRRGPAEVNLKGHNIVESKTSLTITPQ
jgi:cytochrome b6-f complex iron-sulfur subunit